MLIYLSIKSINLMGFTDTRWLSLFLAKQVCILLNWFTCYFGVVSKTMTAAQKSAKAWYIYTYKPYVCLLKLRGKDKQWKKGVSTILLLMLFWKMYDIFNTQSIPDFIWTPMQSNTAFLTLLLIGWSCKIVIWVTNQNSCYKKINKAKKKIGPSVYSATDLFNKIDKICCKAIVS